MTTNFTCRFDDDLYQKLNDIGEQQEAPLSYVIRSACHEYIDKQENNSDIENIDMAGEALLWIHMSLRQDWYDGLHPDGLQDLVNAVNDIVGRVHVEKRGKQPRPRCNSVSDIWGRCFLNEGYHQYHMVFCNGSKCLWPYEAEEPLMKKEYDISVDMARALTGAVTNGVDIGKFWNQEQLKMIQDELDGLVKLVSGSINCEDPKDDPNCCGKNEACDSPTCTGYDN